jgi:2-methylcitrate dehydratase
VSKTTTAQQIAEFALAAGEKDFPDEARDRLKRSVLDALGCAVGGLGGDPPRRIRALVAELDGGAGGCRLIGGGTAPPDRAALVNGCLVRYLDLMDNIAAPGEVCHPSDNLAALLAAGEYADAGGAELLIALAVAYQVQGRLIETVPTMRAGLNYTTPLAFSVAAGAARLLELDPARAAHAVALAGVSAVSLAVIQAEPLSQWKGLASGETAGRALHNTLLARQGITGPLTVFEGPFGLDRLTGDRSPVDWPAERLDAPLRVSIKRYDAEFQSQSAVDAAVELHDRGMNPGDVDQIGVDVAQGAYDVLGGGSYGPKDECHYREQADHNLKYLVAVALLDGAVGTPQYEPDRINRADVQSLLRRVRVRPRDEFTRRVPHEMPCRVRATLADGTVEEAERTDYPGHFRRPMTWDAVTAKFHQLAEPFAAPDLRDQIVTAVRHLEDVPVRDLARLLNQATGRQP